MKSHKDLHGRGDAFGSEDLMKKAVKLDPIKKSGKEKRSFIKEIEDDDETDITTYKRESVLDYFDDGDDDL